MKIALIGYGKMGQTIEEVAIERGHEIVTKITQANLTEFTQENLIRADVAIEFTHPEAAFENVIKCLSSGLKVVSGSTGWTQELPKIFDFVHQNNSAMIWSSNFSVGANLFFALNKHLSMLMKSQSDYKPFIEETHHTQKKDIPSGTAISLAEQIIETNNRWHSWTLSHQDKEDAIFINSKREDKIPGIHHVKYHSKIDDITISHFAHSRRGFALGAVLSAEYIADKKGVFTMKDVLGIG